ncbi:hypothetical protein [Chryseobacterium daeguense]|uniref:hypothetical protein n=1 Tax=Chryseobacterium daeguense TaxID=412438 RepID=UPI0004179B87|nr:hypothetical protein [Chryseobacterium daeguense]
MLISQSLIKEVLKQDHCPKQIYFSFVMGYELYDPSENMLLGRYFESELLGACRGGLKQEPNRLMPTSLKPKSTAKKEDLIKYIRDNDTTGFDYVGKNNTELAEFIKFMPKNEIPGEKTKAFLDCDNLILFAKDVFNKIGLDISKGKSQVELKSKTLSGNIDHENEDLQDKTKIANYDLKWTATKEDDRWNGWGDPENDIDSEIQAAHYSLVSYEKTGKWRPFYFIVFGKDKWVKIFQFKLTHDAIDRHKERISHTASIIREYAENNYKGNGSFNKCISCPFYDICEDKSTTINIETITI